MTRWRKRVGPAGMEKVLSMTIGVAVDAGAVKESSFERITVDTTVQPKNIAYPTDSRLYLKALQILVRQGPGATTLSCAVAIPVWLGRQR